MRECSPHAMCHVSRVMCHMSPVTCHMSFFFAKKKLLRVGTSRWRVCYQWGLPCLVFFLLTLFPISILPVLFFTTHTHTHPVPVLFSCPLYISALYLFCSPATCTHLLSTCYVLLHLAPLGPHLPVADMVALASSPPLFSNSRGRGGQSEGRGQAS